MSPSPLTIETPRFRPYEAWIQRRRLWLSLGAATLWAAAMFVEKALFHVSYPAIHVAASAFGFGLASAGLALRFWALGVVSEKKRKLVVQSGPYRYTRNPLYVGTFVYALGLCALSESLAALFLFLFFFLLLYRPTMHMEECDLTKKFGDDFLAYRTTVPLFFPRVPSRLPKSKSAFRFKHPVRETVAFLFFIAVAVALGYWGASL